MLQLRIQTQSQAAEEIEELLFSCGAVSVSFEDAADEPILEPSLGDHPLWSKLFIQALFTSEQNVQLATKALQNNNQVDQHIVLQQVAELDWQADFQQQFSAQQFGPLWVYPSWEQNPAPEGLTLQLDPGLAFGTGHHATTSLCLQWLGSAAIKDCAVIDFGCGSGILALAACRLGAKHVYAVDIDPQALIASKDNITRNHMALNKFTIGNIDCITDVDCDLIIANILAAPLQALRDTFHTHLKPNGTLVVSGILQSQIALIKDHYASMFECQEISQQDEWACISFSRNR